MPLRLLEALAAAGVFASLVPLGLLLRARLGIEARHAPPIAVDAALGLFAWSLVLGVLAVAGAFHPAWHGIAGWIVTALVARSGLWKASRSDRPILRVDAPFVVAGLLVLAWLYAGFPTESIIGDRDEGLYTLMAMQLRRTGSLALTIPIDVRAFPQLFADVLRGVDAYVPGLGAIDGRSVLRFPAVLPAWIAQLTAVVGSFGLFRFNALLGLLAIPLFHAVARRLVRPAFALVATAAFAFEPAQVWIARVNLGELLGQVLALAGLWLILARTASMRTSGCALLGLLCYVRIECLLLAPALAAAALAAQVLAPPDDGRPREAARTVRWMLAAQGIAMAALWLSQPTYFADHARFMAPPVLLALLLVLIQAVAARARWRLSPPVRTSVAATLAVVIALAFCYGAVLRPMLEPFSLVDAPDSPLHGLRDYREQLVPAVAAYVGWPVLALALAGVGVTMLRLGRGLLRMPLLVVTSVTLTFALALLTVPTVTPEYPWAMRRFVPLAIPGVFLLAAVGAQALLRGRRPLRPDPKLVKALTIATAGAYLAVQWATLLVSEHAGLAKDVQALAERAAPWPRVMVRDDRGLAGTLLIGYGLPVVPYADHTASIDTRQRALWGGCTQAASCLLVHEGFEGLGGLRLGATADVALHDRHLERTPVPLPASRVDASRLLSLTAVEGLDAPDREARLLGGVRDWRIDESGFETDEVGARIARRWTNGAAELVLPAVDADVLEVWLGGSPDPQARATLRLDGDVLFEGAAGNGLSVHRFPLSGAGRARHLRIESSVFVPSRLGMGPDARTLGVSVIAVRLIDSAAPLLTDADADGYDATVLLRGMPATLPVNVRQAPPLIEVANRSRRVWPSDAEALRGEAPVSIHVAWFDASGAVRAERRMPLPFALRPGERVFLRPPVEPVDAVGRPLPPGRYGVVAGLVLGDIRWFPADRAPVATHAITIAASAGGG